MCPVYHPPFHISKNTQSSLSLSEAAQEGILKALRVQMTFALKSKQLGSLLPKILLRVVVALLDLPPEPANELH